MQRNGRPSGNNRPNMKRLEDMLGKLVLVISKQGYWYVGLLKGISNRGIVMTMPARLEPVFENDQPVRNEDLHATVRRAYPFVVPVDNSENLVIRKLFLPWSNINMIARAKKESEIEDDMQETK